MDASFWNGKRAPGIKDTIDVSQYETVIDVIEHAFKAYPQRPAFTGLGHTLTFQDIDFLSASFAHYLQQHTNLKPGDSIAIQMPNVLQYPIAMYGALRAGLRVVNTNPLYTESEMLHQFNDADVKALLCMDVFAKSVQNILPQTNISTVIVTSLADMLPTMKRVAINAAVKYIKKMVPSYSLPNAHSFRHIIQQHYNKEFEPTHMKGSDDTIVLQYTGGTTGVSKGAELTNRNLVANMLQAATMLEQEDNQGNRLINLANASAVAPLPLYHIYSFTVHLMAFFHLGMHSVLIANPRDTDAFIKAMKPWQLTGFIGLNTLFVSLMANPKFKTLDFSKMKFTLSGGTALHEDTAIRWKEMTGSSISEAYGLTETSPAVTMNPLNGHEKLGTVGQALQETAVMCIDDNENEVALGERGELCIRGPQVMKGYWQQEQATKDAFTKDGLWFKTGDVAVIDEQGYVSIVDRIKDMILVSGFNVYPNEIEDVLSTHPEIENCAAIGVPDDHSGETVKVFIIAKGDKQLSIDEVKDFCRKKLTAYKLPRQLEYRNTLPMTPVGKILRRELR
ncbi:AMP-binding protein [Psychrobium sp. 1_MG-2023]|uniref:AMP-binding protein n=1 Tax=Psychrobium sp. 1_MG-2023 TaxID=3062624 RepID=UPI000C31E5BD|nr:AMP-binding protein [Psychrobium sp. 1_MG-2023]MDP2560658.1 AMP-binding protein [Psychrobium sp. 1_MG-2023]PKF56554.1 long-chain fatty acid--CoA ligase [Alteromonadales bacterium alter-6D02]